MQDLLGCLKFVQKSLYRCAYFQNPIKYHYYLQICLVYGILFQYFKVFDQTFHCAF